MSRLIFVSQWYNFFPFSLIFYLSFNYSSTNNRFSNTIVEVVKKVSSQVFIPLTVGGGIRNVLDMKQMLEAGADKVSINSSAVADPSIINKCSNEFGSQCVVSAIDVKRNEDEWIVY